MTHPRAETDLSPASMLRLAILALDRERPGTIARLLEPDQISLIAPVNPAGKENVPLE